MIEHLANEINKIEKFLSSIDYSVEIPKHERLLLYENVDFHNKRLENLKVRLVAVVCEMYGG